MSNHFRKKPVAIEAIRWTGSNQNELQRWAASHGARPDWIFDGSALFIRTLEGKMLASIGDWVIRGVAGEFYPCKPEIFAQTYDAAGAVEPEPREAQLRAALQDLLEVADIAPEPNCACHVAPPCGDCVEWAALREACANARELLLAQDQATAAGAPRAQQPLDGPANNAGVATGSRNGPPSESVTSGNLPPSFHAVDAALTAIAAEVARAMAKFPTWPKDPLHAVAVVGEEAGELTKAVLQAVYEPHKSTMDDAYAEALQTGAMAVRFLAGREGYVLQRCEMFGAAPESREAAANG